MMFVAKKKNLRIILKPGDVILDDKKNPIVIRGKTVEFYNGRYATEDKDEILALINHPLFKNRQIATVDDHEAWLAANVPEFEMVTGARSSTNINPGIEDKIVNISSSPTPKKSLEEIVAEQVALALGKFMQENKPKKVFTCKACQKVFPSGIALGEHKKAEHTS